jgi:hypothetical protein
MTVQSTRKTYRVAYAGADKLPWRVIRCMDGREICVAAYDDEKSALETAEARQAVWAMYEDEGDPDRLADHNDDAIRSSR